MPNCKNCNKKFPNAIVINGIRHILNKRKYCLECSPFGLHNTRPFGYIKKFLQEKSCNICNKPYKAKGNKCPSCSVNIRRFFIKEFSIRYLGGKCLFCGYNKCKAALVFHHKNPKDKLFTIGGHHGYSLARIKRELDKCILLCHNCHDELHYNEHGLKREILLQNNTIYEQYKKQYKEVKKY